MDERIIPARNMADGTGRDYAAILSRRHQRITLRVFNGLNRQVNIQLRPEQMPRVGALHILHRIHRRAAEPRELHKGKKQLALPQHEPQPMLGDVSDLNLQSAAARLYGYAAHGF